MRIPVLLLPLLLGISFPSPPVFAGEGVHGRVSLRGVVIPGLQVHAFAGTAGAGAGVAPAASTLTGQDGSYRLPLPPGSYTLLARVGGFESPPAPGDPYCFYGGNPVKVRAGEWVPVGFNLVKVPVETRRPGARSAIEGTVTFAGQALEDLAVTLYPSAADSFRGPGLATSPVGAGGRFRLGVPPGRYFLVARKRAGGGRFGPVEMGDHFNYYPLNPVLVERGETVRVSLETVTRLSLLEEGGRTPRVSGRVVDPAGGPVFGVRVFAFPPGGADPGETAAPARPLAFSAPSDERGMFSLDLPREGSYLLVASERFGDSAAPGGWRGWFRGGEPLRVEGDPPPPLEIVVVKDRR